jgi:hypothetical protein
MHEFGNTSNAIATHLGLATVGIEHSHPSVGFGTWANQNQPISANSLVPV